MVTLFANMFKSWRLGKLFGFPIEINLSFLILLGIVVFGFQGGLEGLLYVSLAFGSVVLHELGHAIVARQLGVHVAGIELGFLGGAAKMTNLPRTPRHEILIAAAGPAVSLMLAGAFIGIGFALGPAHHGALGDLALGIVRLGFINLIIAGFNLIPALPMDGGRILRALLVPRFGYVRATDISVVVARVAAVGFVILGLTQQMYMMLVLAPFLWLMGTREKLIARMAPPEESGWYRGGVEVIGRDTRHARSSFEDDDDEVRAGRWDSPFDPRSGRSRWGARDGVDGGMRRFTIVRRNGRVEIVPLDD